ncbi:MAG: hypothetical protein IPJ19_21395 [Planctomycetes bacterium]|nr:hypothetical protein [Planctomycetota bacterium]
MSRGRSLLLHAGAGALLLGFALAPLWRAGLVGADLALFPADGTQVHTLSVLGDASLELSRSLFGTPGAAADLAARALRGENALFLFLSCLVFSALLRRTLRAWLGDEVGFAAQRAAVVLLPLHPWCALEVACIAARGELLGLLFAALAALAFLRARQESEQRWFAASFALALAAGFASAEAWLLAPLCGILEWIVARRHRSALARSRTTLSTLAAFALATIGPLFASGRGIALPPLDGSTLASALTGLGRVIVPVHPSTRDLARAALAGAALLLVLQPALVAARSAPRTWGRFALAWALLEVGCLASVPLSMPAAGADLSSLRWLCAPALCLGAACASAATAHSGWKRAVFPWVLALALLALDRPIVHAFPAATQRLERLVAEIAAHKPEPAAEFVLLAPPRVERGLELLPRGAASAWLSHAAGRERELVLLDTARISAWAASANFPAEVFVLQPSASVEAPFLADVLPAARSVQRRARADERFTWREKPGKHLVYDVDPRWLRCVRARLRPDAPHEGRPHLSWSYDQGALGAGLDGVWIEDGDTALALFDLGRDPHWLLCGRVRSIWLEGNESAVAEYELAPELVEPQLAEAPTIAQESFRARLAPTQPTECGLPGLRWRLVLFDPAAIEEVELEEAAGADGALEFRLPQEGWAAAGTEWCLEARVGEVCVARVRGRR